MSGRLAIEDVTPTVGNGRYPSKAVVGEQFPVSATVWREGHDAVAATVAWRGPHDRAARQIRMVEIGIGLDRYGAVVTADDEGWWTFRVDAWSDPWTTWKHAVEAKVGAGQNAEDLANDLENGARLLERVARRPDRRAERELLTAAADVLRDGGRPLAERIAPALDEPVLKIMYDHPVRDLLTRGRPYKVWVDRTRALYGSWYELFPRSTGGWDERGNPVHGTLVSKRIAQTQRHDAADSIRNRRRSASGLH